MLSESARMATAHEAAFRINAANSLPRHIAVVAVDQEAADTSRRFASELLRNTRFFCATVEAEAPDGDPEEVSFADLNGNAASLGSEIEASDLVVMLATAGTVPRATRLIGELCSLNRITTTVLVLDGARVAFDALAVTLAEVRPWALMLVIAEDDEYVGSMLSALHG
jgi:hypothetical protein